MISYIKSIFGESKDIKKSQIVLTPAELNFISANFLEDFYNVIISLPMELKYDSINAITNQIIPSLNVTIDKIDGMINMLIYLKKRSDVILLVFTIIMTLGEKYTRSRCHMMLDQLSVSELFDVMFYRSLLFMLKRIDNSVISSSIPSGLRKAISNWYNQKNVVELSELVIKTPSKQYIVPDSDGEICTIDHYTVISSAHVIPASGTHSIIYLYCKCFHLDKVWAYFPPYKTNQFPTAATAMVYWIEFLMSDVEFYRSIAKYYANLIYESDQYIVYDLPEKQYDERHFQVVDDIDAKTVNANTVYANTVYAISTYSKYKQLHSFLTTMIKEYKYRLSLHHINFVKFAKKIVDSNNDNSDSYNDNNDIINQYQYLSTVVDKFKLLDADK